MIVKIIVVIILIIKVVVILVIILNLDHAACSVQQVWIHPGVTAYQVQHLHLIFWLIFLMIPKLVFLVAWKLRKGFIKPWGGSLSSPASPPDANTQSVFWKVYF